jgi:FMN phosphatase YigB (HAD superfamily)
MNFKILKKKLSYFDIIIFDLDDTIYSQARYDNPALFHVSKFLEKIINKNKFFIFKNLRKLKKIRRGLPPKLIFNKFLKKKNIYNKKKTISKCISLFQNYDCKELQKSNSLKNLIKSLHKKKFLFLVTNGNIKRQSNKIKYLGISRYFKKIFILDGINKMVKPSIKDVIFLSKFIKKNKCLKSVYVGDNIISDKKFARNLKIPFIYYQFPY